MTVYRASRKSEGKDGKSYWTQVGYTVLVGEYNGQPSVQLIDERTGIKYPCFPPKPKEPGQRGAPPPSDSDCPF